jgi:hypothetical protein
MDTITWISVDIETDGPLQGTNSMRSVGMQAYTEAGSPLSSFYRVLKPIEGGITDPACMNDFWAVQPRAYAEAFDEKKQIPIIQALNELREWRFTLPIGKHFFLAKPVVFDGSWIMWYMNKYLGVPQIQWRWRDLSQFKEDIKFFAGVPNRVQSKEKKIIQANPFNHHALYDAKEQGEIWCMYYNLVQELMGTSVRKLLRLDMKEE